MAEKPGWGDLESCSECFESREREVSLSRLYLLYYVGKKR
jgi:hypothetical protein